MCNSFLNLQKSEITRKYFASLKPQPIHEKDEMISCLVSENHKIWRSYIIFMYQKWLLLNDWVAALCQHDDDIVKLF